MNYSEKMTVPGKRLGGGTPRVDPRTLRVSKYTKALPSPPPESGLVSLVKEWPVFLNDVIGDCAQAAFLHMREQWTAYAGKPLIPTNGDALDLYEGSTGYNPNNPASDQGTVLLDFLNYLRQKGLIVAYAAVNPLDTTEIQQTVVTFGGAYIGIALPITAQNPPTGNNGLSVWLAQGLSGNGQPGSWGGHCVPIVGYGVDSQGDGGTEVVTWGQLYDMTYGFIAAYCTEAYAIVTQDWIEADGKSPSGFDITQLLADLQAVTA
jgi:hypothetical protein